jgi:HTH-type transcriptional regulator, sugar sensing transcriptional regulator
MINPEKLQKFGLTRKEALVYIALLELGEPSAVTTISKRSQINRTTTYDILTSLLQKNLCIDYTHKNIQFYSAEKPEKLISYLQDQSRKFNQMADEANELLPELKSIHNAIPGKPRVHFFEGTQGLIHVYEDTLTSSSKGIRAYASDQANQEAIPNYFPDYYKRRTEKNIPIRAIFPDTPKDRERHKLDSQELRESRIVPKSVMDFTPEINIYDNKIMIADWKEKLGIIIESEEIVKVFKQSFDLAWEAAESHHKKLMKENKNDPPL